MEIYYFTFGVVASFVSFFGFHIPPFLHVLKSTNLNVEEKFIRNPEPFSSRSGDECCNTKLTFSKSFLF